MMVENFRPGLFGLRGECLLLVVAVILEEDARPVGEGMPHEYIIIAEGLHVDAPFVPFVGNADGALQKTHGKVCVVAEAQHAVQQLLENDADVIAVRLGIITGEMIVAGRAGTAAPAVGLLQNRDPRAALRGGNGRAPGPPMPPPTTRTSVSSTCFSVIMIYSLNWDASTWSSI